MIGSMVKKCYILAIEPFFMNNKNTSFTTNDIGINRNMNIKIKTVNIEKPNVIELNMTLYAVPKKDKTISEYEECVDIIKKGFYKICKKYVKNNDDILSGKFITDINFSSTNVKRNKNKSVAMSLYIRQTNNYKFTTIKNKLKGNFKDYSFMITDLLHEQGFSCYKTKHT